MEIPKLPKEEAAYILITKDVWSQKETLIFGKEQVLDPKCCLYISHHVVRETITWKQQRGKQIEFENQNEANHTKEKQAS